jgi:hypothetical protein
VPERAPAEEADVSEPDPETTMVLSYLGAQRRHVLGILEGLDEDALRRSVQPSGWSCLGLVRHLAIDVEQFWFAGTVAAEPAVIERATTGPDDGWQVGPEVSGESVLELYREQCRRSDEIITGTSLDAAPAWWPEEMFGSWRMDDLREVVLHVLAETATHAGHLDVVREQMDGRQWMVLTD